jgi:hypothetical protein
MRRSNPRLDNLRAVLFLVVAILGGYLTSNAIQERVGSIHTPVDWFGGALASLVGIAIDVEYRRRWGNGEGWRKYFGPGGGAFYYVPFWCLGLGAFVASCVVFYQGGARW